MQKISNQNIVFVGIVSFVILLGLLLPAISAVPSIGDIPPTRAFQKILVNGNNVTASKYNANVNFTGGENMNIQAFYNNATIRFSATSPALSLEQLTNVTSIGCAIGQSIAVNASAIWDCANVGTGDVTGAANVGGGTGLIFRDETAGTLNFKTLVQGSGITLTNNADDITIATSSSGGYTKINNLDGGDGHIVATNSSSQATFKPLVGGTGISIINGSKYLTISSTVSGGFSEMNSYPGGNARVLRSNSSGEAIFKSFTSGSGISLTNGTDTITVTCTGCGTSESTTGSNLGTSGQGVFSALVGFDLQFKRLISSTLSITSNSTNVILESVSSGFTKINSLNGGTASIVATNQSNQATFKTLTQGTGITITNGSKTITISSTVSGGKTETNSMEGGTARILKSNSTTEDVLKSITQGSGMTITNGTNTITFTTSFKADNQTVARKDWLVGYNNLTGDWTARTFGLYNTTCTGNTFVKQMNNNTGFTVCATPQSTPGGSGFTTIASAPSASAKILAANTSNTATFKSITQGAGISITNGSSAVTIANNGVLSVSGTANNVTVSSSTGNVGFNLGSNVVVTGGSAQTFVSGKKITTSPSATTSGFNIATRSSDISQPRQGDLWISGGALKYNDNNNVTQTIQGGGIKNTRWGNFIPNSATALGAGILGTTAALDGTETFEYNTTRGVLSIRSATGAVAGNNAGISQVTANFNLFRGDQNPYLRIEAAPTANMAGAGTRIFIGFQSGAGLLPAGADTIVNALSAAGICKRTTDSTYQLCTNDAVGAGTYTNTGVSVNTNWHIFEVFTTDGGASWCVMVDGGSKTCDSTDEPATTTRLYFNAQSETTGVSLNFNYGYVYVQNDK